MRTVKIYANHGDTAHSFINGIAGASLRDIKRTFTRLIPTHAYVPSAKRETTLVTPHIHHDFGFLFNTVPLDIVGIFQSENSSRGMMERNEALWHFYNLFNYTVIRTENSKFLLHY